MVVEKLGALTKICKCMSLELLRYVMKGFTESQLMK